jgi:hypothetical protein
MKRTQMALALVLAGAIVLLAGCGGTEVTIGHGAATLNCKSFPFIGSGKDDWRKSSASFGPFGMLVTDYAKGSRHGDGLLHTKIPALVEGHRSVVLTVPSDEFDRVAIEVLKPRHPLLKLRLEPCPDRPRTIWAAGVATRDHAPVRLDVAVDGKPRGTIAIGAKEFER